MATSFSTPSNSVEGFQFLYILDDTSFFFFYSSHSTWYKAISHCGFYFHFPDDILIVLFLNVLFLGKLDEHCFLGTFFI